MKSWDQTLERGVDWELRSRLARLFDFAAGQVARLADEQPGSFPIYTMGGKWRHGGEAWTDWCGGFLAGMAWLIADHTQQSEWIARAQRISRALEPRQHDRQVHDLGFIFLNSYLPWYRSTGDRGLLDVLISAGRTLAGRFHDRGQFLRSFLAPDSLFIDIMMNVPLIYLAARETGDTHLDRIARAHTRTTETYLVREDGSTAHEGIFDLATGRFLRPSTQQGVAPESTWSRGLTWSLYGYCQVYQFSRDPRDLAVASRNAECFLHRCGQRIIPPWDFDAAAEQRIDDSSAGAIAASGLLALAQATKIADPTASACWQSAAVHIMDRLLSDDYIAWKTPGWEGVLKHGVYHFHKRLGVDESVMWGDFFLLEAAARLLGRKPSVTDDSASTFGPGVP